MEKRLAEILDVIPPGCRNHFLARTACRSLKTALWLQKKRAVVIIGTQLLMLAFTAVTGFAQGPNPFGGSGTTRLAHTGSNVLVIATWLALFVGLLSFALIPVFVKMEWNYMKLIASGATGLGGFVILGSIAYDIVNLSSVSISDPSLGR